MKAALTISLELDLAVELRALQQEGRGSISGMIAEAVKEFLAAERERRGEGAKLAQALGEARDRKEAEVPKPGFDRALFEGFGNGAAPPAAPPAEADSPLS